MEFTDLIDQVHRYAEDLNTAVRQTREKDRELVATRSQLFEFARDLNTTFVDLKTAHREMQNAYMDTIHRLALAAEYKDEDTGDHILRMSRYCVLIAEKLGLPDKAVENILYAAPMHDIGKIGIPDQVLMKKGRLTAEEFDLIKTHTVIGGKILADSSAEILQVAERIAVSHHEKWNGAGYPRGLAGEAIPIEGRITALPDTFDALTSRRPYKEPYPVETALGIIKKERGRQFDPRVVDVFMAHVDEVVEIMDRIGMETASDPSRVCLSERDRCDSPAAE